MASLHRISILNGQARPCVIALLGYQWMRQKIELETFGIKIGPLAHRLTSSRRNRRHCWNAVWSLPRCNSSFLFLPIWQISMSFEHSLQLFGDRLVDGDVKCFLCFELYVKCDLFLFAVYPTFYCRFKTGLTRHGLNVALVRRFKYVTVGSIEGYIVVALSM